MGWRGCGLGRGEVVQKLHCTPEAWGSNGPGPVPTPPHTQGTLAGATAPGERPSPSCPAGAQWPNGSLPPDPGMEGEAVLGAGLGLWLLFCSRNSCALPGLPVSWAGSLLACGSPPHCLQGHPGASLGLPGSLQPQELLEQKRGHGPALARGTASLAIPEPGGELSSGCQPPVVHGGPGPSPWDGSTHQDCM